MYKKHFFFYINFNIEKKKICRKSLCDMFMLFSEIYYFSMSKRRKCNIFLKIIFYTHHGSLERSQHWKYESSLQLHLNICPKCSHIYRYMVYLSSNVLEPFLHWIYKVHVEINLIQRVVCFLDSSRLNGVWFLFIHWWPINLSQRRYEEDWVIWWKGLKGVFLLSIDTLYIETS